MKKLLCLAMMAALLTLGAYCSQVFAQGRPGGQVQPMAGNRIGLVDVSRVFKNHARFKGMMGDMKNDVKKAESWVKGERLAIGKLAERLRDFNKGTPDYKALEKELAKRHADMTVQVQLQKNDFLQSEAKIYYHVYQEIQQATTYICRQNGIDIVFRFNGDKINPNQPDSVLTGINRPVVFYNPRLDITDLVLAELNRTAISPGAADRRGTAAPRATVPFGNNR